MQSKDGVKTNVNTSIKSVVVKKKKSRFFETYISKVLKQLSDKNGITSNSKQQLNSALCIVSRKISSMVVRLTEIAKKKTMSDKEVSNAISIIFSGDLAKNSIREGEKSVTKFGADFSKGSSRQGKAGIVFPPSIAEKFLRNFGYSKVMVTSTAPVFLASVLEYLVSEILVLASKSAFDNKRIRITIRDLQLSVGEDNELSDLFDKLNISFIGGGEIPYIHPCLASKKPRKKKKVVELVQGTKKPHRFRPGTVALREIKKFQKMSNCLTFAKFPFERFVRSVVNKNKQGMKIAKDVFIILQYYIEQYIVGILKDANLAAIHTGRVKLMLSDVEFICKIRGLSTDGFSDKKVKKEKKNIKKQSETEEDQIVEEDQNVEEESVEEESVEEEETLSSSEEDNVEE
jgi:histone H3/H4